MNPGRDPPGRRVVMILFLLKAIRYFMGLLQERDNTPNPLPEPLHPPSNQLLPVSSSFTKKYVIM